MRRDCTHARKLRYDAGYRAVHSAAYTLLAAPPPPHAPSYCLHLLFFRPLVLVAVLELFFFHVGEERTFVRSAAAGGQGL